MSETPAKLNLTPQERRILIGIFLVVVFVLNYLFVWPHFGEWSKTRRDLGNMYNTISNYNREIARDTAPNGYRAQLSKLRQQGGTVEMSEQVQLQRTIHQQASRTGVDVNSTSPISTHGASNAFFEDQSTEITFDSREPQLIDFLYNIGNDPAMIRVSQLNLRPADQNRYRLSGSITLTASYSKRPAPAAAAASSRQIGVNPSARAVKPPAGPAPAQVHRTPPPGFKPTPVNKRPFPFPPGQRKGP